MWSVPSKNKNMKHLFTSAIILCAAVLHAQDAIYKKDKTKIEAKVFEVGNWDVKYKTASNPEGPVYTMSKADIAIIIYQNGTSDIFSSEEKSHHKNSDSLSTNFCRNFIGIDIGEFTNSAINMTYEHTFGKKGMVALRLPFSVSVVRYNYYSNYGYGKILSTGLDFLYFPTGQGKFRYYAAPYGEFGMYNYNYSTFDSYTNGNYYYSPVYYSRTGYRIAGGVKNGILFMPTKHFSITADIGFGIKSDQGGYYYERAQPYSRANFILGFRF